MNWDILAEDFIQKLHFLHLKLEDQRNSLIYFSNSPKKSMKNIDFIMLKGEKISFYWEIFKGLSSLNSLIYLINIVVGIIGDLLVQGKTQREFSFVFQSKNTKKILENMVF